MMPPTVVPNSLKAPMTVAPISPPAIAYSTTVRPSSSFQNEISVLFIVLSRFRLYVRRRLPALLKDTPTKRWWVQQCYERCAPDRTALTCSRTFLPAAGESVTRLESVGVHCTIPAAQTVNNGATSHLARGSP